MEPLKPARRVPIPPRGPARRVPIAQGAPCTDFVEQTGTPRTDFVEPLLPTFASVVAWKIPRWLQEELGWVEPYGPPPRTFWWERRSWRWWGWFVVYVVAGAVDLVVFVAASAGR
jgi:hypothetical protein